MTKYVKNPDGAVHSVADDFELPGSEPDHDGWSEVTEAEASPALLGTEPDAEVAFHELRENPEKVVDESGPAQEPGVVPDQPSNDIQPPAVDAVEPTEEVTA